jgi:hypothetical protein
MSVCWECCVLSGRGLCDELITRPEESYRMWCVAVCVIVTFPVRSHTSINLIDQRDLLVGGDFNTLGSLQVRPPGTQPAHKVIE